MSEIGFAGLGLMGAPMARNLVRSGLPLTVWNRSPRAAEELAGEGAERAATIDELFERCDLVICMLASDQAVDEVLGRGTEAFAARVSGCVVVNMGTHDPAYVERLAREVGEAGGTFVEAPVSGSRVPAERGELVAMVAGPDEAVERVREVIAPMCRSSVPCGQAPSASLMKIAVNVFLIGLVTALAESQHLADRLGLDLATWRTIVDEGQMASAISRVKTAKLVEHDFSPQAACLDVHKNAALVRTTAERAGVPIPLSVICEQLFAETVRLGHGGEDMVAVLRAIESA